VTLSWSERAATDPTLQAFLDAEIAKAHVELQTLRVEYAHYKTLAEEKQRENADLLRELKDAKKSKVRVKNA